MYHPTVVKLTVCGMKDLCSNSDALLRILDITPVGCIVYFFIKSRQ